MIGQQIKTLYEINKTFGNKFILKTLLNHATRWNYSSYNILEHC